MSETAVAKRGWALEFLSEGLQSCDLLPGKQMAIEVLEICLPGRKNEPARVKFPSREGNLNRRRQEFLPGKEEYDRSAQKAASREGSIKPMGQKFLAGKENWAKGGSNFLRGKEKVVT